MNTSDFLHAVWGPEGPYALATPFTIPNGPTVYAHKVFQTIPEASRFCDAARVRTDIFFCVHTLVEERVWNAKKLDRKTGELGAWEVRVQRNMRGARVFFFDMDIGDSADKYASREEAITALKAFCKATGLPKPMLVSSGRGLHVYWCLDAEVPSEHWRVVARQLRKLATHHALRIDPMRTTDTASVLRVAGTFHLKDRENPKPVKVLQTGTVVDLATWTQHLQVAVIRAGVSQADLSTPPQAPQAPQDDDFEDNVSRGVENGPPVSLKALGKACGQVRSFVRSGGRVAEPVWYAMIQLLRHVEDGRDWAHKISDGQHSAEIDAKFAQLESKDVGPTTCQVMGDRCGESVCMSCPHLDKIKSPIVAARLRDLAKPPIVLPTLPSAVPFELPDPPEPFSRLKTGGIGITTTNQDGDETVVIIYDHDLYPIRRIIDSERGTEQQVWRVHLPRGVITDFVVDAAALYRADVLAAQLANNGVYPRPANIRGVQEYMSAYIAALQRAQDAAHSHNSLGWHDDFTAFVLPDKTLRRDGSVVSSQLTGHAEASSHTVTRAGTLERQVELLRFYAHPAYHAHQVIVLGSLGAPLFHMTGHHGVVINATGDPGASKSTSLYTAASLWAHPQKYPLNGTNHGATQKARAQRMVTMGSLPVCVDEITTMSARDAQELVMNVTQPEGRIGLNREGKERRSSAGEKSTIMLCTANNSLHGLLSHENSAGTAGSMRVVEIRMRAHSVHEKHEADTYLLNLRENFGHIGEVFIAHVLANYSSIADRVRAKVRSMDTDAGIQASERFWSASLACALVAGEIARELGLLSFDTVELERWLLDSQVPEMRGIIVAEYGTAASLLADYLESISGNTIVTSSKGPNTFVLRPPAGALLAHFEYDTKVMIVLKSGFKNFCARVGADMSKALGELGEPDLGAPLDRQRVVPAGDVRRTLGGGTEYGKLQSRCFIVNMNHTKVSGTVRLEVVEPSAAAQGMP